MAKKKFFNYNEPLKLPRGSVRAILAILIIGGAIAYFLAYKEFPKELIFLTGTVIGFYFGARTSETRNTPKDEDLPDAV